MPAHASIQDFLLTDPITELEQGFVNESVRERLGYFLPTDHSPRMTRAFNPFVEESPWRYWDPKTVGRVLEIIERDRDRTVAAIRVRRGSINRGLENLFRKATVTLEEGSLDHRSSRDLIRISTEFLPEYLRWAEHVYGNLLEVYWSIAKKGGVDKKFTLKGAAAYFGGEESGSLIGGFSDSVRNAIAHGQVVFSGSDILFGLEHPVKHSSSGFLRLFDELCRTANAMALGFLLAWTRNNLGARVGSPSPLSVVLHFAAGGLNRSGVRLVGGVETENALVGRQLQISVELKDRARQWVLAQCTRIAAQLLEAGAEGFDRLTIEIDHGAPINSLVALDPEALRKALKERVQAAELETIFERPPLLWLDESLWRTRLRGWMTIVRSALRAVRQEALRKDWESGRRLGRGRFRVRAMENLSGDGVARLHLRAVLKNPKASDHADVVREILRELIRLGRKRFLKPQGFVFRSKRPRLPKRPSQIFVTLYRNDGTLRWLKGGGWAGGNMVAVAERVWGRRRKPVFVTNPQEVYDGIRVRYTMDEAAYRKALAELEAFGESIRHRKPPTTAQPKASE